MKAIRPTTSEKLHSQSELGRTNEWMKGQTEKLYDPMLSMQGIKLKLAAV